MRKNTKFKSFMRKLALLMSVSIALMTGCVAGFADQGTDDNTEREIWLNIYTADICVDDSIRIKGAYNTLEIPESGNFVFSSTNDSVASVDADGNVSAVSVGAAWINVSDGELSSSCSIFVTEPKKAGVKLGVHSIGIARNSSYVLSAELGEEYKGQKIIWSSDDSAGRCNKAEIICLCCNNTEIYLYIILQRKTAASIKRNLKHMVINWHREITAFIFGILKAER